jgi:hypothetical protein
MVIETMYLSVSACSKPSESKMSLTVNLGRVDGYVLLDNVYCCYLPAHCSHGLQPLGNGVLNASKAAYRKELQKLTSLTDSAPVDKLNFIKAYTKAYTKAREVGMTKKNIL